MPKPFAVAGVILDLLFYPVLALYMIPYLKDADLKVERVFYLFFGLLLTANALVHFSALGFIENFAHRGLLLGLNTLLIIVIFMGGRVIPFFTESSIAKAQPKTKPWIEVGSHITAWLFLLTQFFFEGRPWIAAVGFSAALFHGLRLIGWQVPRVRRVPLIWVLHVAYFAIVAGFILSGLNALGFVPRPMAIHAFTVGGLGLMILGMIARVSLGHTGRRLHPSRRTVVAFYFLIAAALIRVGGALLSTEGQVWTVRVSGVFWILAFGIYLGVYFPILMAPRIDGREG
jgi:uncharacterized protein involved in response to NO